MGISIQEIYGTFYPNIERGPKFEAQWLVFPGKGPGVYRHEEPDWWIKQIHSIGTNYLKWQFNYPEEEIDYRNYRTFLQLSGEKKGDYLQETDTISRLVYGFASAYLLTGEEPFLEAAEKGILKALYIMGENPLRSLPQPHRVKAALQQLDFLVVERACCRVWLA